MAGKYLVEKLVYHNYTMWKTRMKLFLKKANIKGIVNGREYKDGETISCKRSSVR